MKTNTNSVAHQDDLHLLAEVKKDRSILLKTEEQLLMRLFIFFWVELFARSFYTCVRVSIVLYSEIPTNHN